MNRRKNLQDILPGAMLVDSTRESRCDICNYICTVHDATMHAHVPYHTAQGERALYANNRKSRVVAGHSS